MFDLFTVGLLNSQTPSPVLPNSPPRSNPVLAQGLPIQPITPFIPAPESPVFRINEVIQRQEVRPLPGTLDTVPVFNSNSPEVVRSSGILLSTFPPQGKFYPDAHLNFPFEDRFDIFAHHIAKTDRPDTTPTLYQGILVYNPSRSQSVVIDVLQAASFLGTPDAPFIDLPALVSNELGQVYSGPGSRVADFILRGRRQAHWPSRLQLGPGQTEMLMNLPIPVPRTPAAAKRLMRSHNRALPGTAASALQPLVPLNGASSSNARSTLMRLHSSGPVYIASMAMLAPLNPDGTEHIPSKREWEGLLVNGRLLAPRDIPPSPLNRITSRFYYGRVAGVSRGAKWEAQLTDTTRSANLTIPASGEAFSYGLGTLQRGTFGTGQVQSAPMLVRYPDTAYLAHGNYGVHYQLALPLYNPKREPRAVMLSIQTPLKQDLLNGGLRFLRSLPDQIFFRGTVRVRYRDDEGNSQVRYFHLTQRQGQQGDPLVILNLKPKEKRLVNVDYLYPPDATPPQVLTVQTLFQSASVNSASLNPASGQQTYEFKR